MLFPQKINVVASARHANPHNETVVVQNDTAVEFYVAVVGDNGQTELPEGATYTLVCLHLRKQPTEKLGTLQADGNVMFKLTHMELSETGPVQGQVRVYHPVGGRLTSNPFIFHVAPDPTYGAEIKPEDQSIIEQVIGEGPAIIAEAKAETELSITERTRLTGEVDGALLEMSQSKDAADQSAQAAQQAAGNADDERERLTLDVSDKLTEVETARSATVDATGEAMEAAGLARDEADAARLQKEEVQQILGAGPVASVNGETGVVTGLATQESMDQVTAQLAEKANQAELDSTNQAINLIQGQKVDQATFNITTQKIDFLANGSLVDSIDISEAGNALAVQSYIDSLVTNGDISGVTLANESIVTSKVAPKAITNDKLANSFLFRRNVAVSESIDTIFDDGTYYVLAGNIGTYPVGADTSAIYALEVKNVSSNWVHQTMYPLTNPRESFVRAGRRTQANYYEWSFIPFVLKGHFLYRRRIEANESFDKVYDDGSYIITAGNIGNMPNGENHLNWVGSVITINGVWTYQTLWQLENPSYRFVRRIRNNRDEVDEWQADGGTDPSMFPDQSIYPSKLHPSVFENPNIATYKILMVGNSFSLDATTYLHEIAARAGVDLIVGVTYKAGESLSGHYTNATNNSAVYEYFKRISSGSIATQERTLNVTLETMLADEEWDVVTLQQASGNSDNYTTFQPHLDNLKTYINSKLNHSFKYGIHQTWAYATSRNPDQMEMYANVVNAYKQAQNDLNADILIPNGTAVQNARTLSALYAVDDELTSDGYHLGVTGDYIGALCMFEVLLSGRNKKDLSNDLDYKPAEVSNYHAHLAKLAVKNAVIKPFTVTELE